MYILIAIVFIAELIIAFNLINLIVKADKKVCELISIVEAFKPLAETFMQYARCKASELNKTFEKAINFIRKKQEQIVFKTIIMIAIYAVLIVFKIKFQKASKIYKLIAVMRDLAFELSV